MIARTPLTWICVLFFVGVIVAAAAVGEYRDYRNAGFVAVTASIFLFFFHFAAMLVAVGSGRRERMEDTEALRRTFAYSGAKWLLGRWLALMLPFTVMAWIPLLALLVVMFPAWNAPGMGTGIAYLTALTVPTWFVMAAGFTLGERTPGKWSYLVAILFYVGFAYGIQVPLMGKPNGGTVLFELNGYVSLFQGMDYSLLWGFSADSQHWLHRLFYFCLTAFLLLMALAGALRRRGESGGRAYTAVGIAVLAVAAVIPFFYFTEAERRYEAARQAVLDAAQLVKLAADREGEPPAVHPTAYRLLLDFAAFSRLKLSAQMEMSPGQAGQGRQSFDMVLDRAFTVTEALLDGKPVHWERGELPDVIRFAPDGGVPDSPFRLTLNYEGNIRQWKQVKGLYGGDKLVKRAFAGRDRVWLSGETAWYPMTPLQFAGGQLPLIRYELELRGGRHRSVLISDSAETAVGERNGRSAIRLAAESREPLELIGGPFEPVYAEGERFEVTLFASTLTDPSVTAATAAETAKLLDRLYAFMQRTGEQHGWPVHMAEKVTLMPLHEPQAQNSTFKPDTQLDLALKTTRMERGWLEVDEAYPSGFAGSQQQLLWQWLEYLSTDEIPKVSLQPFVRMLREYLLSDEEPPVHRDNGLLRYELIYRKLGREAYESFVWSFYRELEAIGERIQAGPRGAGMSKEERRTVSLDILDFQLVQEGLR